jgi:beta-lactamase regulating signal transducer with metallopeptidase domain
VLSWPWSLPTLSGEPAAVAELAPAPALGTTAILARSVGSEDSRARFRLVIRPDAASFGAMPAKVAAGPPLAKPFDIDGEWLREIMLGAWMAGSVLLVIIQVERVIRFRQRLIGAFPAPRWMTHEIEGVAAQIGVRAPEAWVVPGLSVPMVWCLGRPLLLVPEGLVKGLGVEGWRGVLTHELAHLRRGDHWVSRLMLLAGWVWWWNPVFWLARARLDAEAELACDAWVVDLLPGGRVVYAETLFDLCSAHSRSVHSRPTPAPALGVTGAAQFFEKRLTMILGERVSCRLSLPAFFGAGLLTLLALPSWTVAEAAPDDEDDKAAPKLILKTVDGRTLIAGTAPVIITDDIVGKNDDDDDDADDDDDDDKPKTKTIERRIVIDRQLKTESSARSDREAEIREQIEKAKTKIKEAARLARNSSDPSLAKAREDFEQLSRELAASRQEKRAAEAKQRADERKKRLDERQFAQAARAKASADAKQVAEKDAKAKKPGKIEIEIDLSGLEEAFGPNSDFVKSLEKLGPEIEKMMKEKFGEGSDFMRKLEEQGKKIQREVELKFGDDSKSAGSQAEKEQKEKAKIKPPKPPKPPVPPVAPAAPAAPRAAQAARRARVVREQRIKQMESRIEQLTKELEKLQAEADEQDDDERP